MTAASSLLPGIPTIESPLFETALPRLDLSEQERQVARDLNERGYAVIDFPDPAILERIDRIQQRLLRDYPSALAEPAADKLLGDLRVQDAWKYDADVKAIAANAEMLSLLSRLYGRRAFPFQTLNFPVGTQQPAHSVRIPRSSRAAFRFDRARHSELMARSVPRIVRASFRNDRAQFGVGST